MPFYTLLFNTKHQAGQWYRDVIISPDRKTADLLYRSLQEFPEPKPGFQLQHLSRLSPQIWTYEHTRTDVFYTILNGIYDGTAVIDANIRKKLRGKVFLDHLYWTPHATKDFPILPKIETVDLINGRVFHIRNKRAPDQYWALHGNFIVQSKVRRSAFRVTLEDKTDTKDLVMIGGDRVKLRVLEDRQEAQQIFLDEQKHLTTHKKEEFSFRLGALEDGGFTTPGASMAPNHGTCG
jgi:hypothetical protein